jgi:hypothetical protein
MSTVHTVQDMQETIADLKGLAAQLMGPGEGVHDTSFGVPSVTVMTMPSRRLKESGDVWEALRQRTLRYGQPVVVELTYARDNRLLRVKLSSTLP